MTVIKFSQKNLGEIIMSYINNFNLVTNGK